MNQHALSRWSIFGRNLAAISGHLDVCVNIIRGDNSIASIPLQFRTITLEDSNFSSNSSHTGVSLKC